MKSNENTYKDIEFFKNEFDDNFLLLYKNKTLSVGFIVKDILILLQNEIFDTLEIKKEIFRNHTLVIERDSIEKIIETLNKFTIGKDTSSFLKFGKLINPGLLNLNLNFLFDKFLFYLLFACTLGLNIFIYSILPHEHFDTIAYWLISIPLLVLILFFHELGHSSSAKKYNVNCKEIGIGLYIVFPIFYTNLGESWKLRKDKRVIINLSGIYFQLILGSVMGLFAMFTDSAILTTLFFTNFGIALLNLNPFLKLDGYWVVSDLLNTSNLSKSTKGEITKLFSSETKSKINFALLIYAFFRIIFIVSVLVLIIKMSFSFASKIYYSLPLSYSDYILLVFFLFYIIKHFKNGLSNRKTKISI